MRILKTVITLLFLSFMLCGCSVSDSSTKKVADIDFTVVDEANIPQKIKDVIAEKKRKNFGLYFRQRKICTLQLDMESTRRVVIASQ